MALKRKVLIISDDILLSRFAQPMFEDLGLGVKAFEKSAEGIEACFADLPDLLIIKYSSTGKPPDAFSIVRVIRQDKRTENIAILMISTVEKEARAVGVTDWVDVVFDVNKLAQRAASLLAA